MDNQRHADYVGANGRPPDAPEPPFIAVCVKCGCQLRRSWYDWIKKDYWFDDRGLAGCPEDGFHEGPDSTQSRNGSTEDR